MKWVKIVRQCRPNVSSVRSEKYDTDLLIRMYGKVGNPEDGIEDPEDFSWNTILHSYIQRSHVDSIMLRVAESFHTRKMLQRVYAGELDKVYFLFERASERFDEISWKFIFTVFARKGYLDIAKCIFDSIPQPDVVDWNTMIQAYAHKEHLQEAKQLFLKMPHKDTGSWTVIVAAFAQHGYLSEAQDLFNAIPRPDSMVWDIMITAYAQYGYLDVALDGLEKIPHQLPKTWAWTAVVQALGRHGNVNEASELFGRMPDPTAMSWNALVEAFMVNGYLTEAWDAYQTIVNRNDASRALILEALCSKNQMQTAKKLFDGWLIKGVVIFNAMVAAYTQHSKFHRLAEDMFYTMPQRDVASYNIMIAAYTRCGRTADAMELVRTMDLKGFKPNYITTITILLACRDMYEARSYFHCIISEHGFTPKVMQYNCIVEILAQAGRLSAAESLVQNMPFVPDEVAWRSLLAGCELHGHLKRRKRLMKQVKSMENGNNESEILEMLALLDIDGEEQRT